MLLAWQQNFEYAAVLQEEILGDHKVNCCSYQVGMKQKRAQAILLSWLVKILTYLPYFV